MMNNHFAWPQKDSYLLRISSGDWDSEVRFALVDPDGNQVYDSGNLLLLDWIIKVIYYSRLRILFY